MEDTDTPDSEEIERLWKEKPNPPPPTPPMRMMMTDTEIHKAQLEHKREYHRKYYHKHKATSNCPHCGKDYSSVSSLRRHQGRSSKCQVQKLVREVDELKSKLASNLV